MRKLFVDSDFLVGIFNEKDSNHEKALQILDNLKDEQVELWISNLIRQESATVVSHRVGMDAVRNFVRLTLADVQKEVRVDVGFEKISWRIFLRQNKKGCSFVDCSNLAIIEKFKLDGILSFDKFYPKSLRIV